MKVSTARQVHRPARLVRDKSATLPPMLIGTITEVVAHLAHGLALAVIAVVVLGLARVVFSSTTRLDPATELIERSNTAYGLYLAAFLSGTAIALAGTLFGRQTEPLLHSALAMICEGLLLIVLMRTGCELNDRLVLTGFSLEEEISEDHNRGAAFCVGGSCLATGLVLNGALSGFSDSLLLGVRDTVVLWALGQVILVIGAVLYRRLAQFDIHQLIQYDDNAAAGLRFGSFLAGLGLVVRGSLLRAHLAESSHVVETIVLAAGGLIAFAVLYPVVRRLVLLTRSSNDEVDMQGNMSVSQVDAAVTLGLGLLIAQAIQRTLQGVPIDAP